MSKPIALITGITGQDGSYLSELLVNEGYEVHGIIRRASLPNTQRIDHIFDPELKTYIHYGDLSEGLDNLLYNLQPDEIYNLGAMSHVRISFDVPVYTGEINAIGVTKLLESVRHICPGAKFYQASSSEIYGTTFPPQNENSCFNPVSPYGIAKLYAYHMTKCYREGYGLFASNGILFNHESERRGINFVTRKITIGACKIKLGLITKLPLGNLDAKRDWGHSKDYVKAMHMILQHNKPDDFVVSTGEAHSVREFLEEVFKYLELDVDQHTYIVDSYRRPIEVPYLCGDSTKIRKELGWEPTVKFKDLVKIMVDSDMELIKNGKL